MSLIEWRSELLLHSPVLDEQHQELVARANVLHEALFNGEPRKEILVKFSALSNYAEMHFRTEEQMIFDHGYDGYEAHTAEHARLLEQIHLARREFADGAIDPCQALALFIRVWTEEHIVTRDKQLAESLKSEAR